MYYSITIRIPLISGYYYQLFNFIHIYHVRSGDTAQKGFYVLLIYECCPFLLLAKEQ